MVKADIRAKTEPLSFLNGKPLSLISVSDRGLCYGHGLFETMRLTDGSIPLLDLHRERLVKGAKALSIDLESRLFHNYLQQLLDVCPDNGVVKIILTAGAGNRGYRCSDASPNYLLQWSPLPQHPKRFQQQGVTLKLCQHRLACSPQLAGIKHLNRLDQVLARSEWDDEYDEGLMLDQQGHVVEAVSGNLFFYAEGSWFTPKLDQSGVAGVMRQYIMEQLLIASGGSGYLTKIIEKNCSLDDLLRADEVFICNSVNGIWPVLSLEHQSSWSLGPQTLALQAALYQSLPGYLNNFEISRSALSRTE